MNDDELMKKLYEELKQQDMGKITSDKELLGGVIDYDGTENSNLVERKHPKNLLEIKKTLEEVKELRLKQTGKEFLLKDEETELISFLSSGIVLEEIPYHQEVMEGISAFLSSFGYDRDFVFDNLKDMEGHVCPLDFLGTGKAQALRDHIDLDIDFFKYDEEGNVVGVSDDKKDLFRHVVIHEFFHKLSSYKKGHPNIMVGGDALLEGFTDLFARLVSGNKKDNSDLYEIPTRVCEMFAEMMGMDKALEDYIKETGKFPNLRGLFNECGLTEESFMEFRMNLDSIVPGVSRDKKKGLSKEEWALDEKTKSIDFLRDNIIIPYCRKNPEKAERLLNKFNNLFEDMGYSCSMEDVKGDKKAK